MASIFTKYFTLNYAFFYFLLLIFLSRHVESSKTVKFLPGFSGVLPFKLKTGYVQVNESELFYLFVESQGNPVTDPLLVYIIGGPGCSALNGFFFQTGPLMFDTHNYSGGLPQLLINPYAWTKTASIIFLDAPVGTGYSYAKTTEGYYSSDIESSAQVHVFLREWLSDNPEYLKNRFYIATDSYNGLIAPILAQEILLGNNEGFQPSINLQGIISGSAHINSTLESNSIIPLSYHLALLSRPIYESAKNNCNENYIDVDSTNGDCLEDLEVIDNMLALINEENILEPLCAKLSPKTNDIHFRRSLGQNLKHSNFRFGKDYDYWCRNFVYKLLDIWANDKNVKDALHVRRGTVKEWYRCNINLQDNLYDYDVQSAVPYYQNLTNTGLQVLLYGGDHDLVVPYISTLVWLEELNITADYTWAPWYVQGQVAGYVLGYMNYGFRIMFTTLKGSGHSPTQYMPMQCYAMFERWINFYPL